MASCQQNEASVLRELGLESRDVPLDGSWVQGGGWVCAARLSHWLGTLACVRSGPILLLRTCFVCTPKSQTIGFSKELSATLIT